jgi:hypothetical protein
VQCRHCSLLRMKLADATVNFLRPTIREFGAPAEPITIMHGGSGADLPHLAGSKKWK